MKPRQEGASIGRPLFFNQQKSFPLERKNALFFQNTKQKGLKHY